ncbi:hypothetical protein [Kaistella carnis]|uniref:Uncharacterized protein n=1 Tax=Kaistella carnis TaxID=1241979 RepID=A0A3G8XX33_9FLAO|nr:hypothetical protein [Kaistella carnis]AZI32766.1 hypothetical protein EIB73_05970 [Kaistella carnis]
MNKNTLSRLQELKNGVEKLPNILLSESDFNNYYGGKTEEERAIIDNKLAKIHEEKNKLMRQIIGFFNANLDENSNYYTSLSRITFRPKEGIYNVGHYKNDEAWRNDKNNLLNLLDILESEIKETMKKTPETSENIFKSPLFWTILPIAVGLSYFLGTYKAEFDKSELEKENAKLKTELNETKTQNSNLKKEYNNLKQKSKIK